MPKVLIIEPLGSGHRLNYVEWLSRAFKARGYTIQIGTKAETLNSPQLQKLVSESPGFEVFALPDGKPILPSRSLVGLVKHELYYYRLFRKFFRSVPGSRPDIVFIPYMDYAANAFALAGSPFGRTPWAGIILRPVFHLSRMGAVGPKSKLLAAKEMTFRRLLKNPTLQSLFTIDEMLFDYVAETYPVSSAKKLRYLRDPAEMKGATTQAEARRALGLPKERRLLLVYGSLTLRKGIDSLIGASALDTFPKSLSICLAGKQDQAVADLLKTPAAERLLADGRLHLLNRFLTPDEEYLAFAASDIVWLGYREHFGMSGVLVQAGRMGLPVLACREGLVAWLTKKHKLGIAVSLDDEGQIMQALRELSKSGPGSDKYAGGQIAFANHTPENFGRCILDAVADTDRLPYNTRPSIKQS